MAPLISSQHNLVYSRDLQKEHTHHLERYQISAPKRVMRSEQPKPYHQSHPVLRGTILTEKSTTGMSVHLIDALAVQDFSVEVEAMPCLKITIFFEGETHFLFDDRTLHLEKDTQQAKVMTISRQESCRMQIRDGNRRLGLYVAVTPEWFVAHGFNSALLQARLNEHLSIQDWALPRHLWLHARKLLDQPDQGPMGRLSREGFGIALVAAWLLTIDGKKPRPMDSRQVQRFVQFLSDEESWALSLNKIGNHLGMSSATLQRYAKEHLGMSLTQYLRKQRLNRACHALYRGQVSIMDVALMAGYNHPNNFTVAFKRQFGVTPTEVHQCSLNHLLTRH